MVQSYEVRARESPHRNSTFVNNFKSLFRRKSRKTGSPKRPTVVKPQDLKAPIADPEASEPSSLISSTSSPPEENNNQNSGISIPEDSNRYEIRKPVKRKVVAPAVRPQRKPGVQHRRSFGRRINNLWSSFGLLRSSEKIVEFASGYGEYKNYFQPLIMVYRLGFCGCLSVCVSV